MLSFARPRAILSSKPNPLYLHALRVFSTSSPSPAARLPPRPVIQESDLEEAFLKGSGPGGQKINKTSSAVQLKHIPTGTVIKSQATRSRSQNRKIARRLLAEKIEAVEKGDESRTALKGEVKRKRKASKSKKARRKYGAKEGKEGDGDGDENEDEEEHEGWIKGTGKEPDGGHIVEERV